MLQAGDLDRRIHFLRAPMLDDGLQVRPGDYAAYGSPVWASVKPVSDAERFRADSVFQDMSLRFRIRWSRFSSGITGRDRLVFEGITFGIAGIKEIGRREGLEITATRLPDAVSA